MVLKFVKSALSLLNTNMSLKSFSYPREQFCFKQKAVSPKFKPKLVSNIIKFAKCKSSAIASNISYLQTCKFILENITNLVLSLRISPSSIKDIDFIKTNKKNPQL